MTTTYTYKEDTDFVESITHLAADGVTVLSEVRYERALSGEPTKNTREDGSYRTIEYDASVRVEKESYYDSTGTLIDEIAYTYDADGNRQTVSGGEAQGTYTYDNVHQLSQIDTDSGVETYTYDDGGRVETVTRDGETLRFEYDENDQLTKVLDGNNGVVVEYTYDSSGRRVAVTDSGGERDVVVAPTAGGLESPFLIVKENQVEAAFTYAGDRPLARVDEDGSPVYYLTDAMGSVMGLVDGNGQEIGDFEYDSFGNLRSPEVLSQELGGDFRFQGQWLESNTDLYHFRARYYDPETGRFVSRDPVEIVERVPESSNPYQFVYNNPYVYSDPTGEFSISELNTTQKIQDILRTHYQAEARAFLKDKVGEAFSQVATTVLDRLLPGTFAGDILDRATDTQTGRAGTVFENFIQQHVCRLLPNSDLLWLTPQVEPGNGKVQHPGFSCNQPQTQFHNIQRNPDFLFEKGDKRPFTKHDPYNRKYNQYSWLIGDIKITTSKALSSMNPNTGDGQWKSIYKHAATYQSLHFASYITFKHHRSGGSLETTIQKMKKIAIPKGIHVFVVVLFD